MKDTLQTIAPTLIGTAGASTIEFGQHDISTIGQMIIVLFTVVAQLWSLIKKKKPAR